MRAAAALKTPALRSQLKGDLAILDGPESLTVLEVHYKTANKFVRMVEPEPVMGVVNRPVSWVIWLAGGVFLLTFLILIVFTLVDMKRWQKSGERYGSRTA